MKSAPVFALVSLALWACATSREPAPQMRALTYNIRLDTDADGENAWPHRREAVSTLLRFHSPDIIGLQEVKAHQLDQLRSDLPEFEFFGVGRDDGAEAGEFSPIGISREQLAAEEWGTFWLSETPEKPSTGFDAAYPRIVTWARLKDRRSGAPILALNTHWDHVGRQARIESARLIRDFIRANRRKCETVVLVGDLNATPEEEAFNTLVDGGDAILSDARRASTPPPFGPPGTFNGFDIMRAEAAPIDHLFVSRGVRVLRHGVITQHESGRLPSDHYPVLADIVIPQCAPH